MKFHFAEVSVKHHHEQIRDSKVTPFDTELTIKDLDVEVPVEESIETLKNGGADLLKQFLDIIKDDCREQKALRHEENEIRKQEAENEAERLRQAKASK